MGKQTQPVIGYNYYMGVQFVITGTAVDEILEVIGGERTVWKYNPSAPGLPSAASYTAYYDWLQTPLSMFTDPPPIAMPAYLFETGDLVEQNVRVTGDTTIKINADDVFGGDKREGGYSGEVTFSMGTSETRDPYLVDKIDADVPAYVGVTSAIFKAFKWAAMNPYFKAPWFRCRRILSAWHNGVWYSAKAKIGEFDMNPAHIIYQCITEPSWGMGYPTGDIDDANFRSAADKLFDEGFGLSLIWDQDINIESFIRVILDHINGDLRLDMRTGKYKLVLIRDDYDVGELVNIGPSEIVEMRSFSRVGNGESANQLTVLYTDRDQNQASVSVQDIALISNQRTIIATTREYFGVRDAALAMRLAMRDLPLVSGALAKLVLTTDRTLWAHERGDVFLFTWPKLGINAVPFRIVSINKGSLVDGVIEVEAIEDVFGMPANGYTGQQPNEWVDPVAPPQAPAHQRFDEMTYRDIVRYIPESTRAGYTQSYYGLVKASAISAPGAYFNVAMYQNSNPEGLFTNVTSGQMCGTATLVNPMVLEYESVIQLANISKLSTLKLGQYCTIDDEICLIKGINTSDNELLLGRGCVDTVPALHAIGARVWFNELDCVVDPDDKSGSPASLTGEASYYKLSPTNGYGSFQIATIESTEFVSVGRAHMPYPMGQVKINGDEYPEYISGEIRLEWAARSANYQADVIVETGSPSTLSEIDVKSTVIVKTTPGEIIPKVLQISDNVSSVRSNRLFEFGAGYTNYGTAANIKAVGIETLETSLSQKIGTALSQIPGVDNGVDVNSDPFGNWIFGMAYTKVANGWQLRARFVNSASGVVSSVTTTPLEIIVFNVPTSVPHHWGEYDPLTPISELPFGYATLWFGNAGFGDDDRELYTHRYDNYGSHVIDKRGVATNAIQISGPKSQLLFTATYPYVHKKISYFSFYITLRKTSDLLINSTANTRVLVDEYYVIDDRDLDDPYRSMYDESWSLNFTDWEVNNPFALGSIKNQAVVRSTIVSELLYVNYYGGADTLRNTAGRIVDVSNILGAHIDYYSKIALKTKLYRVTSAGVITQISDRVGYFFAEKFTSGAVLEVSYSAKTVRSVNDTTGATIADLATLTYNPCAIYYDQSDDRIYILGTDSVLRKYNGSMVLISSHVIRPISVIADENEPVSNMVGLSRIYESASKFYINCGRYTYSLDKDLSSQVLIENVYFPYNAYFAADSSDLQIGAKSQYEVEPYGLATENGTNPSLFNGPTPRYPDTLYVEMNTIRNDVRSFQKHQITVKRAGWGLRWGECWGGVE